MFIAVNAMKMEFNSESDLDKDQSFLITDCWTWRICARYLNLFQEILLSSRNGPMAMVLTDRGMTITWQLLGFLPGWQPSMPLFTTFGHRAAICWDFVGVQPAASSLHDGDDHCPSKL
jgi:hypothetical protein